MDVPKFGAELPKFGAELPKLVVEVLPLPGVGSLRPPLEPNLNPPGLVKPGIRNKCGHKMSEETR